MISRLEKNKKTIKKIDIDQKKKKTKKILFFIIKIIVILSIIFGTFFVLLRYIGTSGIIVKEYSLKYKTLPKSFHGFKIVQFSDINYGSSVDNKKINEIVNKINKLKPDLIVFTGNLKYEKYNFKNNDKQNIIKELSKLDCSIGKYYITGNNDNEETIEIFNSSNFSFIDDTYELIYYKDITPIILSGIINNNNINIDNKNLFNITLLHMPDNSDEVIQNINPNIIMSGNSLNGQIRLPYFGALIKFNGSKKYYDSYYKINNTDLFISGGIGTNTYPLRAFNHPSINFYRLKSSLSQ